MGALHGPGIPRRNGLQKKKPFATDPAQSIRLQGLCNSICSPKMSIIPSESILQRLNVFNSGPKTDRGKRITSHYKHFGIYDTCGDFSTEGSKASGNLQEENSGFLCYPLPNYIIRLPVWQTLTTYDGFS